jgi:hypothetical protein
MCLAGQMPAAPAQFLDLIRVARHGRLSAGSFAVPGYPDVTSSHDHPALVGWSPAFAHGTGAGLTIGQARPIRARLASEQALQFCHRHANVSQDAAERSFGDVASRMDRHSSAATVGMAHYVVAASYPRHRKPGFF